MQSRRVLKFEPTRQGSLPPTKPLIEELKKCGRRKDLQNGRLLHSKAIQLGYHKNKYVANALMTMYSKCGCMNDARAMFDGMTQRDVVSWTALIAGYTENGQSFVALDVFHNMDCQPDAFTFAAALKACAALAGDPSSDNKTILHKGMSIHRLAQKLTFHEDVVVANILVDMYSRCGEMRLARQVFAAMQRDVVSWNALLHGYVENQQSLVALEMFDAMDCQPDRVTFIAALKACAGLVIQTKVSKLFCLKKGFVVHGKLSNLGYFTDIFVASTLVDMYRKLGSIKPAYAVFERMVERNAVALTALILRYVESGETVKALNVFDTMDCQPDGFTFVAALKACTALALEGNMERASCLQRGIALHARAKDLGLDKDKAVTCTLIEMYSACGDIVLARRVFDGVSRPDVTACTALMLGYVDNGESLRALEVFSRMNCEPDCITFVAALKACGRLSKLDRSVCLEKGVSIHKRAADLGFDRDIVVANTLLDMYCRLGDMELSRGVFERMVERDVVSWTTLILGYVESKKSSVALEIYSLMDCEPNEVTLAAALKACACMGDLDTGRKIHDRVRELGLEHNQMLSNCLVDFYGKCGDIAAGEKVFSRIRSPGTVSWNALIGGYSLCGDAPRVFDLVKKMQESGSRIDSVTVLLILSACSYAGLVEEGHAYFESMHRHGVTPTLEHYNCLVNILGRANKLDEALSIASSMPLPLEANAVTWTTLLGACRKWKNEKVGKVAFDALVLLGDEGDAAVGYVLMGDIYRSLGRVGDLDRLHERRMEAVERKVHGETFWFDRQGRRIRFVVERSSCDPC